MRLIDADAFKEYCREGMEEMKKYFKTDKGLKLAIETTESFLKDIDEQPTVNPKQEVCEDAVSREAVIRLVEQYPNIIGNRCSGLIADIKHLPSVIPQYTDEEIDKAQEIEQAYVDKMVELAVKETERPKGKWIKVITNVDEWGETWHFKCSICGEKSNKGYRPLENYCHNCGAEMGGAND